MPSVIDSCEIVLESLQRRATLVATRPDLADDAATVLYITERRDPAIGPCSLTLEHKLTQKWGYQKGLQPWPLHYCYAVIKKDDREHLSEQLFDLFGAEYLMARALKLRRWMDESTWYEERPLGASVTQLLAQLEQDTALARSLLREKPHKDEEHLQQEVSLNEVAWLVSRMRQIAPKLEWAIFKRRYAEIVGDLSVGTEAAIRIHAKALTLMPGNPTAFQLPHGPDFLTVSLVEIVPEWTVLSVLMNQKSNPNLPKFPCEFGMRFTAKNLSPIQSTGVPAPPGALRFGDYIKQLEEGYMWVKTRALENFPEPRAFSSTANKQYVKLLTAPDGAAVGLL